MQFTLATSIVALVVLAAAAPQPAGQSGGVAIPITIHSNLVNNDTAVNMEALDAHIASVKNKIRRGLDNFERNTGKKHPSARSNAVEQRASGIGLARSNFACYGYIGVGTPTQYFTVDFDTGSSELFVPSVTCYSCGDHTLWDPEASTTSVGLDKDFELTYGDGDTAFGMQYLDDVFIADYTVAAQLLGAADAYSTGLSESPADGILGMGFGETSDWETLSVFENLVYGTLLPNNVPAAFSFKLATVGAELYIGGVNTNLYTGSFAFAPLTDAGYWTVAMDIASDNYPDVIQTNVNAIIDTGSAMITGDLEQVSDLYAKIGGLPVGVGKYGFACNGFPTLSLGFGGVWFPLAQLNMGPIAGAEYFCLSGIVGEDMDYDGWIVGVNFLQGVYTTFDYAGERVGFAELDTDL